MSKFSDDCILYMDKIGTITISPEEKENYYRMETDVKRSIKRIQRDLKRNYEMYPRGVESEHDCTGRWFISFVWITKHPSAENTYIVIVRTSCDV